MMDKQMVKGLCKIPIKHSQDYVTATAHRYPMEIGLGQPNKPEDQENDTLNLIL